MNRLRAFVAMILACAALPARAQEYVVRGDQEFYGKPGSCWGAFNAPWSIYDGKSGLIRGRDFADATTIRTSTFPAQTSIVWYWPAQPVNGGQPRGHLTIAYGDYDHGPVKGCVPPRRIADIRALSVSYAVSWSQALGDQNLLVEAYAYEGQSSDSVKLLEIGFLPRPSGAGAAFARAGLSLGRFVDADRRGWDVWRQGAFVMLLPVGGAFTTGRLDLKGVFGFLIAKRQLTGQEWFTGLSFGVEPIAGAGNLWVPALSVEDR